MTKDWKGRDVEHLLTFSEFQMNFVYYYLGRCHDFTEDGFLYDEGGVYGLDNTVCGFATESDCKKYNEWRKLNKPPYTSVSVSGRKYVPVE